MMADTSSSLLANRNAAKAVLSELDDGGVENGSCGGVRPWHNPLGHNRCSAAALAGDPIPSSLVASARMPRSADSAAPGGTVGERAHATRRNGRFGWKVGVDLALSSI